MWNLISRALHPDLYAWPELQSDIEKREAEAERVWQSVFAEKGFLLPPAPPPPKRRCRPSPKGRIKMDGHSNVDLD